MEWIDIASIVFVCVTMNHLGLISAIEGLVKHKIPVVNCPKCSTEWSVLAYLLVSGREIIPSLAISFLCSYSAIWLELFEGFIDSIYLKLYEKVYKNTYDDTATADADNGNSASSVPKL